MDGGAKNGAKGIRMEERMLAGPSPFLLHFCALCALCSEAAISRRSGLAATRQELDASVVGLLVWVDSVK